MIILNFIWICLAYKRVRNSILIGSNDPYLHVYTNLVINLLETHRLVINSQLDKIIRQLILELKANTVHGSSSICYLARVIPDIKLYNLDETEVDAIIFIKLYRTLFFLDDTYLKFINETNISRLFVEIDILDKSYFSSNINVVFVQLIYYINDQLNNMQHTSKCHFRDTEQGKYLYISPITQVPSLYSNNYHRSIVISCYLNFIIEKARQKLAIITNQFLFFTYKYYSHDLAIEKDNMSVEFNIKHSNYYIFRTLMILYSKINNKYLIIEFPRSEDKLNIRGKHNRLFNTSRGVCKRTSYTSIPLCYNKTESLQEPIKDKKVKIIGNIIINCKIVYNSTVPYFKNMTVEYYEHKTDQYVYRYNKNSSTITVLVQSWLFLQSTKKFYEAIYHKKPLISAIGKDTTFLYDIYKASKAFTETNSSREYKHLYKNQMIFINNNKTLIRSTICNYLKTSPYEEIFCEEPSNDNLPKYDISIANYFYLRINVKRDLLFFYDYSLLYEMKVKGSVADFDALNKFLDENNKIIYEKLRISKLKDSNISKKISFDLGEDFEYLNYEHKSRRMYIETLKYNISHMSKRNMKLNINLFMAYCLLDNLILDYMQLKVIAEKIIMFYNHLWKLTRYRLFQDLNKHLDSKNTGNSYDTKHSVDICLSNITNDYNMRRWCSEQQLNKKTICSYFNKQKRHSAISEFQLKKPNIQKQGPLCLSYNVKYAIENSLTKIDDFKNPEYLLIDFISEDILNANEYLYHWMLDIFELVR